jgi:hypothetical protein
MTIVAVFAAAFTMSVSAQDFMGTRHAGLAFPNPDRPVAGIISPIWHDEKERDDAGEPTQLVRLLGIKSGMTVAPSPWMRLAKGTARHDEGRVAPANVGSHQFIICCAQFGRDSFF